VRSRFAVVAVVCWLGLVGCQDERKPVPTPQPDAPREPEVVRPVPKPDPKPDPPDEGDLWKREDPEVAAFFKKRGWVLRVTEREPDDHPTVQLAFRKRFADSDVPELSADDYRLIAKSKTVEWLDLTWVTPHPNDEALAILGTMPRLNTIKIHWDSVTDKGVKALAQARGLEVIDLQSLQVTDEGVAALAALPKLKHLGLRGLPFTGTGLRPLTATSTLESFEIDTCEQFNDDGASVLAELPRLKILKLGFFRAPRVTSEGFKAILRKGVPRTLEFDKAVIDDEALKLLVAGGWLYRPKAEQRRYESSPTTPAEVKYIVLTGSSVTDEGFKVVANCTNVDHLSLGKSRITDATVVAVSKSFKKLQFIGLGGTAATPEGLAALADLPALTTLNMENGNLTEDHFKSIGKLKRLDRLNLMSATFPSAGFAHLRGAPLTALDLRVTDADDAAVAHVVEACPDLEKLWVWHSKVGNPGLKAIGKLKKLKELDIDGTPMTKAAIEEYMKAHPEVKVSGWRR
jgi:hypothetical protein